MFEKVNPAHPDKMADRIAGALVDWAYKRDRDPKVAVEVLLGHGKCVIMAESSVEFSKEDVEPIVKRIAGPMDIDLTWVPQDPRLAANQADGIRCGDNGIFRGFPVGFEEKKLTAIAKAIYARYPYDGKYICDGSRLIICQSNAPTTELKGMYPTAEINPLGPWTGGPGVDAGATNRKLGSDLSRAVTGGGLHGKDLSKADVSVTIYAHIMAQRSRCPVSCSCAIGDTEVDGKPFSEIVQVAREYVNDLGGFEALAEWGLV